MGLRTSQEMRSLAERLDSLTQGKLPRLGDILMQRFKAVELAIMDGSWVAAETLACTPSSILELPQRRKRR